MDVYGFRLAKGANVVWHCVIPESLSVQCRADNILLDCSDSFEMILVQALQVRMQFVDGTRHVKL